MFLVPYQLWFWFPFSSEYNKIITFKNLINSDIHQNFDHIKQQKKKKKF